MLMLYFRRKIVAVDFCIAMHWAAKAGLEAAREWGKPPGQQSGKYSDFLKRKLGHTRTGVFYILPVPGFAKGEGRAKIPLLVIPPHEALEEAARQDPTSRTILREAVDDRTLPPCYYDNPLVAANPPGAGPLAPYSLFVDGVPYSNDDSVMGIWVLDVLTDQRFLLGLLRKKLLCRCGCRGWCTLWAVWDWLHYCFSAAAAGRYPVARHDGEPWGDLDQDRAALSGTALEKRWVLLHVKMDWQEYASSCAFPLWTDSLRPCMDCNASTENRTDSAACTVDRLVWRENGDHDYFLACDRVEVVVQVAAAHHAALCQLLCHDRRSGGSHGLALLGDYAELGLHRGDRLEPSTSLRDIGDFFERKDFPLRGIVFWRPSRESLCRHRCPLFDPAIGITPRRCLTKDSLHVLFLGVMHTLCKVTVWELLASRTFSAVGTQGERVAASIEWLDQDLDRFYKRHRAANPTEELTRITAFTSEIVGSPDDRKFTGKGAQTWGFMLYLNDLFGRLGPRLPTESHCLFLAGKELLEIVRIWHRSPACVSRADQTACFSAYLRLCSLTQHVDEIREQPKRHSMIHLLKDMAVLGNPLFYHNWYDEHLNKTLKMTCRLSSQGTLECTVLHRMRALLPEEHKKHKMRECLAPRP